MLCENIKYIYSILKKAPHNLPKPMATTHSTKNLHAPYRATQRKQKQFLFLNENQPDIKIPHILIIQTKKLRAGPNPPTRRRFFVGTGGYDPAQAMAYCAANGGQLASIRNSSELYLLGSLKPQPDRSNGMWIGGHRVAISAPYHWLDGWTATTPYNYFCNGEPQNVEYYVSFWSSGSCIEDFCYQAK